MKTTKTMYALFLAVLTATASSAWAFPTPRIINGVDAGEGEFPYFALLRILLNGVLMGCGGSIIAPDMVLTAAHCLKGVDAVEVLVGINGKNVVKDPNDVNVITRTCETWVLHPEYVSDKDSKEFTANDYALCKLSEPLIIDESYIRLELNSDDSFPVAGTELIAFGLGVVDHSYSKTDVLQNATLTSASTETCRKQLFEALMENYLYDLGTTDPEDKEQISELIDVTFELISDKEADEFFNPKVQLCIDTSNGNESAVCRGDSGGPLVKRIYQGNGSFVDIQVGITSTGIDAESSDKLCVAHNTFARVSGQIDWITSTACDTLNSVGTMCQNNKKTKAPKHTKAPKRTKAPKT